MHDGPAATAPTHQEIERKWLVDRLPDLTGVEGTPIRQGYLAVAADGTEVRVRQRANRRSLTVLTANGSPQRGLAR